MMFRSTIFFALGCLCACSSVAIGQSPPELGRIPASAGAVLHVKVGKIYESPGMKEMRDFLDKAGPRALDTLTQRFQITPFHIDRVTAVGMVPDLMNPGEPPLAAMIATKVDVKAEDFAKRMEFKGKPMHGYSFPTLEADGLALAFPQPRLIVVGQKKVVETLLKAEGSSAPPAFADLEKHDLSLIANVKAIPVDLSQFLPPPLAAVTKANTLQMSIDLAQKTEINLMIAYAGEKEAIVAEDAIKDLARQALNEMARPRREMMEMLEGKNKNRPSNYSEMPEALGGLFGLAMLNQAEEILRNPPIKRSNATLAARLELDAGPPQMALGTAAMGVGLLLPAVQKVRVAAQRMESSNNLKQIALAFHNYESTYGRFPSDILDKKTGKPLLSWRVALLPYIEQNALYQQFKLDEPWDSPNNLPLAKVLVKVYSNPAATQRIDPQGHGLSHYLAIKGPGAMIENGKKMTFANVTDGTSNTIMFVEGKNPVIWTKPADLDFDKDKEIDPTLFGGYFPQGFNAAFGDGSVRFISHSVQKGILKALLTRDGGEVIGGDQVP